MMVVTMCPTSGIKRMMMVRQPTRRMARPSPLLATVRVLPDYSHAAPSPSDSPSAEAKPSGFVARYTPDDSKRLRGRAPTPDAGCRMPDAGCLFADVLVPQGRVRSDEVAHQ